MDVDIHTLVSDIQVQMLASVLATNLGWTLHTGAGNCHALQGALTNTLVGVGCVCLENGSGDVKCCEVQADSANIGHGTDPVGAGRVSSAPGGEGGLVKVGVIF